MGRAIAKPITTRVIDGFHYVLPILLLPQIPSTPMKKTLLLILLILLTACSKSQKVFDKLPAVDANQQLQQKVLAQGLYFAKIHDEQFSLCVSENCKPFCFNQE